MTPELDRFLDLATRPLEASPGDRDAAKGELMARVGHAGMPLDLLDLGAPSERLAENELPHPRARRIMLLGGFLLLIGIAAAAIAVQALDVARMNQSSRLSRMTRYPGMDYADKWATNWLVPYVRQVAPGLPLGPDAVGYRHGPGESEKLLAKQPEDLPMFQEHLSRKIQQDGKWERLTNAEADLISRLDADNALWPLIQITPHMRKATGSNSPLFYLGSGSHVHSQEAMTEALRCFSEAAAKARFTDHSVVLRRRQLDAFPSPRSIAEDHIAARHAEMVTPVFNYYMRGLPVMVEFRCGALSATGDQEGLNRFFEEWKRLSRLILTGEVDPNEGVLVQDMEIMARHFDKALDKLAMPVQRAEAARILKVIQDGNSTFYRAAPEIRDWEGPRITGNLFIPRDLKPEEMLTARRTELAFFDRCTALVFSVLGILVTGMVALEACRRPRRVKGLARGVMPLFRGSDHVWIAGLGLALPWLWWWGVTRLTPLGLRTVKLEDWEMVGLLVQTVAGSVLAAAMLLQTARWRWAKRGDFLGLGSSVSWFGWLAAGLTALAIPAAGMIRHLGLTDDQSAFFMLGVAGMAACGLLWLLWEGVINLFTPQDSALRANLTMRSALPWCLAGVATLLVAAGVSTAMERYWFSKETLLPISTSRTHLNALEERAAADFREALKEL